VLDPDTFDWVLPACAKFINVNINIVNDISAITRDFIVKFRLGLLIHSIQT
jgi:hypothetical protein